jgi:hypothetical protein
MKIAVQLVLKVGDRFYLNGSLKLELRLLRLEATLGEAVTPVLIAIDEGLAGSVDDLEITFLSPFSI